MKLKFKLLVHAAPVHDIHIYLRRPLWNTSLTTFSFSTFFPLPAAAGLVISRISGCDSVLSVIFTVLASLPAAAAALRFGRGVS